MNFYFLLILAMVIWGASWPIAKQIANFTSPPVLIFWRNLLTFFSLLPIIFFIKEKLNWNYKVILQGSLGALIMTTYNYLFFMGLQTGLAGAGGVLVTTLNPIFNFALVSLIYGKKISFQEKFGLSLGFLSGLFLLHVWSLSIEELFKAGNLTFLLASICWAFLSIQTQRSSKYMSPIFYSVLVYAFATLLTFFWVLPLDWKKPLSLAWEYWLPLLYLAVISTAFATTIYFIASSHLGSQRASSYIFLVPASAVISSYFLVDEVPKWYTILGGSLAILSARILHKTNGE
jgi:drug/metabolite transporter (DMT)-like permease